MKTKDKPKEKKKPEKKILPQIKKVDSVPDRYNWKVNREKALAMALEGKTYDEIGAHFGVTKQAISKLLKKHREEIEGYKAFKDHTATTYEYHEYKLLASVDEEDRKKMSGYQKFGSAGLIRDKVRIERGMANQIVSTQTLAVEVHATLDGLKSIKSELAEFSTTKQNDPKSDVSEVIDVTPESDDLEISD